MSNTDDDNRWGWKAAEVTEGATKWQGYTMLSSPQPRSPESLCRWAAYRANGFLVVIALNGKIVGYENSGTFIKAKMKIEKICASLGQQPVKIENPAQAHVKTTAKGKKHG